MAKLDVSFCMSDEAKTPREAKKGRGGQRRAEEGYIRVDISSPSLDNPALSRNISAGGAIAGVSLLRAAVLVSGPPYRSLGS
jgi:hypothetical protein